MYLSHETILYLFICGKICAGYVYRMLSLNTDKLISPMASPNPGVCSSLQ